MTHEEAIRKSAVNHQRLADLYHRDFCKKREEGSEFLASMYSNWSAGYYAIARALLRIEE